MDLVLRSRRPKEKLVCPACKLRQTSYEAGEEGDSVSECVLLWCVNRLCATVVCEQVVCWCGV